MSNKIDSFNGEHFFLSNFYRCEIHSFPSTYPSVEHAYQAHKTLDQGKRVEIRDADTPSKAKRLGRRVIIRPCWDDMKLEVMEKLLRVKFNDPHLRVKLLATGDAELVEGNCWGDTYWGVCNGRGENHLGRLLMKIRADHLADPENGYLHK